MEFAFSSTEQIDLGNMKCKKKALLIGIDYGEGCNITLSGPRRDALAMKRMLIGEYTIFWTGYSFCLVDLRY